MKKMNCPICGEGMKEREFKSKKNKDWQCLDCKITVDIIYALIDKR